MKTPMYRACVAIAVLIALSAPAAAEKRMRAVRVGSPPSIDGRLDDPAWDNAQYISDFVQKQPIENGEPSQRTEVAFAYDDDALYVAARMFVADRAELRTNMTRRDQTRNAERIIVSLDTFRDQRTAYSFAVTAAGVRADWIHPDDSEFSRDSSYDPVWEAETVVSDDRWTAEMRIPFSQLRFPNADVHPWRVNVNRYIPHLYEDIFWIAVPKDKTAWSSYFGEIDGIAEIDKPRRLEILLYAAGDTTLTSASLIDDDDPFTERLGVGGRAGADVKMGLGPSLTLDATFNPDFGQVEADPAVVNLSAFETQFAERRPFFVEGSQLLTGTGPAYYYSRRIGAPPRGDPGGDFADVPHATRIWGAGKVTGRLRNGTQIGALTALTARTLADSYDVATDTATEVAVEPLTTYNVLRVQQEFGEHSSKVGAMGTAVYRNLGDGLDATTHRQAYTGGVDWNLRFSEADYEVAGYVGFSAINGEAEAIAITQQNSTHYFQRPDASHVTFDPNATTMWGWTGAVRGEKRSGVWRWAAGAGMESPGFDLNDVGILFSGDDIFADGNISYRDTVPGDNLHEWNANIHGAEEWNFGGERKPATVGTNLGLTFPSYWGASAHADVYVPGVSDDATRGGPLMGFGWGGAATVGVASPRSAQTYVSASASASAHQTGATGATVSVGLTLRPSSRIEIELSPRVSITEHNRQYIDTIADPGALDTFGARYLFATIDRRELSLSTRMQLAFTPDLTLELYAQPFVASGVYSAFGELDAPRSRELTVYGGGGTTIDEMDGVYTVTEGASAFSFSDPDFSLLSLRSTAVLRWEFRPGSTAFLVWQQNRAERGSDGAVTPVDLGKSATTLGTHTLALKISYWFG